MAAHNQLKESNWQKSENEIEIYIENHVEFTINWCCEVSQKKTQRKRKNYYFEAHFEMNWFSKASEIDFVLNLASTQFIYTELML